MNYIWLACVRIHLVESGDILSVRYVCKIFSYFINPGVDRKIVKCLMDTGNCLPHVYDITLYGTGIRSSQTDLLASLCRRHSYTTFKVDIIGNKMCSAISISFCRDQ